MNMIYIDNYTENVLISKHLEMPTEPHSLSLVNNFTLDIYSYNVKDKVSLNEYFYLIDLTNNGLITSNLKEGEYTFELIGGEDNEIFERGLLKYVKKLNNI